MKGKKQQEDFDLSGPAYLTTVDWSIPKHRWSVAASLVKGAYVVERDSRKRRKGNKALAPKWWEFFDFQLYDTLKHPYSTPFGVIFEYKPKDMALVPQHAHPRYVIAFRGTATKRDFYMDIKLAVDRLTQRTRYRIALQAVQGLIDKVGPASVWLAGHSLGAAIALQAGKDMAKMGCHIETYLFNPPHVSAPIEMLKDPYFKALIRIASSVTTAGLFVLTKAFKKNSTTQYDNDSFPILGSWIPNLFVNPKDPISREFIGYFEHRETMEKFGMGRIEGIAAKTSMVSLASDVLGRNGESTHLIPSAFLTKNMVGIEEDFRLAHGLHQWWEPHPHWHSKLYQMSC